MRRGLYSLIIAVFVVLAIWIYRPFEYNNALRSKTAILSKPKIEKNIISPQNIKSAPNQKPSPPCEVMNNIAMKCDDTCLLNHVREKDPELATMLVELKNLPEKPTTQIARFYKGFENKVLLQELVKEDADNAYPAFYLAALIDFEQPDEAKRILEEALTRTRYRSYYTEYYRRLKQATIDRPEAYARAHLYNQTMGFFMVNTSMMSSFDNLDSNLAKKVALKIIKPTLDLKGEFGEILWNREDYIFARHMLQAVDSTEDSLLPEYEVQEDVLERYSPGLTKVCSDKNFLAEMEREKLRLSRAPIDP